MEEKHQISSEVAAELAKQLLSHLADPEGKPLAPFNPDRLEFVGGNVWTYTAERIVPMTKFAIKIDASFGIVPPVEPK